MRDAMVSYWASFAREGAPTAAGQARWQPYGAGANYLHITDVPHAATRPMPDGKTLAWYTAAALFVERASRAVTRIRPLGLAWMDVLFVQAERVLDCGWGT